MTREQQLAIIWQNTHRDFKTVYAGRQCIMVARGEKGTVLVELCDLTDEEIARLL